MVFLLQKGYGRKELDNEGGGERWRCDENYLFKGSTTVKIKGIVCRPEFSTVADPTRNIVLALFLIPLMLAVTSLESPSLSLYKVEQ